MLLVGNVLRNSATRVAGIVGESNVCREIDEYAERGVRQHAIVPGTRSTVTVDRSKRGPEGFRRSAPVSAPA